ncbi:tripartite tricarboxylate transporter TctB family protein [Falsiroseomonas sp.]|uniref:tripartite tricarboxylate transporter TctB family protein n=1 Tax=Falsiroseomonas sp. TaxID=2870721 RepID=UPI002722D6FD|nr:tripartite tricarboxylate transporter TctB family protein [Falsiroseomonas sp.]MDO9503088.1 tripartite tricarboxylate transporter TctB family protein [Falsiroseomonas sp.]MDP3415544.1 tripartite tricarboxylate transporter TctB family protein [Falsiroseomonas sp.]
MKINQKDLLAGLILMAFAVAGLWLNMDHTLGNARRMGPGYMPMLAFGLLLALSIAVVALSTISGPEKLERWAWRELFLILAAICVFALILEKAGMILTLVVSISIASLADRTHKPLGVLGLIAFLVALCYLVFIQWLDIRIPVWPTYFGY